MTFLSHSKPDRDRKPGENGSSYRHGALYRQYTLFITEWAALLIALVLLTITETYRPYVTVALILLGLSSVARSMRTGRPVPYTGLELPGVLFISSAGIAAFIAFDQPTALLQFIRILAAATLFYAVIDSTIFPNKVPFAVDMPESLTALPNYQWARWLAAGFVAAAAFMAIYWPIQHDFIFEPSKFAVINRIGIQLSNIWPGIPGPAIHSNVAGGTLAAAIPFGICLSLDLLLQKRRLLALTTIAITLIVLSGLVMTGSRGAWLGLIAALGITILAWIQRRWFFTPRANKYFWVLTTLGILSMVTIILISGNLGSLLGNIPDPTGTIQNRPRLWAESIPLIQDYFFTGSGLVSYFFVFPTYSLLTHVPILAHSHNFLLEIWIEQGIVGVIASVWASVVILSWAWKALITRDSDAPYSGGFDPADVAIRSTDKTYLGWAGLAALVVVAIHGIVDVVFYIERTLPLLGFIVGFAYLAVPTTLSPVKVKHGSRLRQITRLVFMICLVAAIALAGIMFYKELRGMWDANLGAIAQTNAELPYYSQVNFSDTTLDSVRKQVDLEPAIQHFEDAIMSDPKNLTAMQRLAAIDLSLGNYSSALKYLQQAYNAGHHDRRTSLLYGDALIGNGQTELAAKLLTDLPGAEDRLLYQSWYRYTITGDYQRAINTWQTILLINPSNSQAQASLADLEKRLNKP